MTAKAPEVREGTDYWTAWDRYLEANPDTGFMQSSWWADFRATTGYEHFGAVVRDRTTVIGGAVVLKRTYAPGRCFYYIPEGPALPDDASFAADVFEGVLGHLDEKRHQEVTETVSHLRIEPRWHTLPPYVTGFRPIPALQDAYMEPRDTLCVDLRPSEDAILAQMKPKGRYNIGVARRHHVSIVEDTSAQGLADFQSIYEDTADRQGFSAKPWDYFGTLVPMLVERGRGTLFVAECEGRRIATAVVVFFGQRATYFFGGSLPAYRTVMAPYLLHFEIMRRAKTRGCTWYDLWGIAPLHSVDHPWAGITDFKRKFGGVDVNLVPTLDLVYDADAYREYEEAMGTG